MRATIANSASVNAFLAEVAAVGLALAGLGCTHEPSPARSSSSPTVHVAPPDSAMVAEEEGFPADDLPADETLAIPTRVEQWEGKGIQNDGQRWNVVVRVSGSGHSPCALVEYPSIPCAGEWRCYEKSTGERLVGVERITTNQDSCIDGCEFDADFEAGTIQYDCGDQGVYAHARIQRTE